jgi:hypothetical protein
MMESETRSGFLSLSHLLRRTDVHLSDASYIISGQLP